MWNWESALPVKERNGATLPRILVIDDDTIDRLNSERLLKEIFGQGLELDFAATWDEAMAAVAADNHDIYLVDYHLGARTGLELVETAAELAERRIFILLTGQENHEVDRAATRAGVVDYLVKKDLTASRLERSLRYATESMSQKSQLIDQAIELRNAKSAVENEIGKQIALTDDLKRTQGELTDALARAEKSERRYRWLAQHDLLTRIPNRTLFADKLDNGLEQASRSNTRLVLMLLDVDRFKWVNDTFGHHAGDALLTGIAERLRDVVRDSDVIARLGGDEFAIIAANLDDERSASVAAERIVEALSKPFDIDGHCIEAGASVGIAAFDGGDRPDPNELIQKADAALYRAKEAGRGGFRFYDDALNEQVQRTLSLKRELPRALDSDEVRVMFQPKIDLFTGRVAGLEALARWTSRRLGSIPPSEFIPMAESTGQIIALSARVFEQACHAVAAWKGTALAGIPVALNLSALQLKQCDFVSRTVGLLDRLGLEPALLELEITETAALENLPLAVDQLSKLRDLGLKISIDDFGTGYSSLSLATSLPADCLKIDTSFVRGMMEDPANAAAVETTITLAHSLGMRTVAEGVENQNQLAYLRERACNEAQGYVFVKPLPADEILYWHDTRQAGLLPAA